MSMRMRRKRNFDARMEACADWLLARGAGGILNMKDAAENFRAVLNLSEVFGNENPAELEIGCGKGGFLLQKAKENPNVNYIGLEKMSNVILTPLEEVKALRLPNVRFLNIRAECLPCYLAEGSLSKIYLNFSTPLPKKGYATQRLTHRNFLSVYKTLLKPQGRIEQKTDNYDFFMFSLEEYEATGFTVVEKSLNLHENGNPAGNIMTEYESRFVALGLPIYRAIAEV